MVAILGTRQPCIDEWWLEGRNWLEVGRGTCQEAATRKSHSHDRPLRSLSARAALLASTPFGDAHFISPATSGPVEKNNVLLALVALAIACPTD